MVDGLYSEKNGIPTITITTTEFYGLVKSVALGRGAADISYVAFPHPTGMIPLDEINAKTEKMFPEILKQAVGWVPKTQMAATKPAYPAERIKFKGTAQEVSRMMFNRGWSMGLPVLPPTTDRVAEMLKGTSMKPGDVIGIVPPRMGVLTVEEAATACAMADCKPEYMPVLIAALKGVLHTEFNLGGVMTTTGTTAIGIFVNGPIVKEIGLAYGQGSAGKGHHANAAIGYAMNSILYTIGGSKPPSTDKGTLSDPSDFTGWVFGENEDAAPKGWTTLAEDKGFKRTDNVVTVMGTYPPVENIDHFSVTAQEHLEWWSHLVSPYTSFTNPQWPVTLEASGPVFAIGPEHASLIAKAGITKEQWKKMLWEKLRVPLSTYPKECSPAPLEKAWGRKLGPNDLIPIVDSPDMISIVIAGGSGKHSHYFPAFPGVKTISTLVQK